MAETVTLPINGRIIVLAENAMVAERWIRENQVDVRGVRHAYYGHSIPSVVGTKPAAIVQLPHRWRHRNAAMLDDWARREHDRTGCPVIEVDS